jgi:predicted aconitase
MNLTVEEQEMLDGKQGQATQKAMEILVALGTIYGAERLIPITSVQVAGVSYDNLGEAGLEFLTELADGGGRTRVLTTLNPAGMDTENWEALEIDAGFAEKQKQVIEAFGRMDAITTCSCTPYLAGNIPYFGEHIAWSESSAVCYANSVLGARTNREGGPSALAAALTGRTAEYGYHLEETRRPGLSVMVQAKLSETMDFGALGKAAGEKLEAAGKGSVIYFRGVGQNEPASMEKLKSLCASLATYGGAAMFHIEGITPEAFHYQPPKETVTITQADLDETRDSLNDAMEEEIDFFSLGCPHLSIQEVAHIAKLLEGKKVNKEFWITTSRPIKQIADRMGYTRTIEQAGAKIAADTCCVVAPIKGRFKAMATDSAKACYYAYAKNQFKTAFMPFDEVVRLATR